MIEKNLENPLTVPELAESIQLSPRRLRRLFRENLGVAIKKFELERRLSKAKELLVDSTLNVSEVGYRTGFQDPSHFCQVFRHQFGITPRQYRFRFST